MLSVQNLTKHFGGQTVLNGVSFQLNERERAALFGANGSGKSTLLKAILGQVAPDGGSIAVTPGTRIAYLAQDSQVEPGRTLQAEMEQANEELLGIREEMHALEAAMHDHADEAALARVLDRHAHLLHELERLGGYEHEAEIGRVLHGLGFSDSDRDRQTEEFSGGWQMRIALAKLLLQAPDVLLLDEPTNHLDVDAVEWLEDYLKSYRGSVLLVSHDRYVLDRVTTRTLELERGTLADWPGNYSWYVAEKERRLEEQEATYARQQRYVAHQTAFIERFRGKPSKTTEVQSRERFLEKLSDPNATRGKRTAKHQFIEAPQRSRRRIKFRFPDCSPSGREVLTLRKVTRAYDSNVVLRNVDFVLERGDRVALVGPNGAGKSTLLRIFADVDQPTKGTVVSGHNVRSSYFAQHQADILDAEHTVMEEVYRDAPPAWTETDVRGLLGRFLFSNDDVYKKIGVLSGGERSRVALAKMLLRPANVLFLDEPTNHLDIPGREVLEQALQDYPGTFVIVSHDRYLIDQVATKIADIANGQARLYVGNYTEYRQQKAVQARMQPVEPVAKAKQQPAASEPAPQAPPPVAEPPRARVNGARAARPRAEAPKPRPERSRTPFSPKRLEQIEEQIMVQEHRREELEAEMANPDLYKDSDRWPLLLAEFEDVGHKLGELNRQWNEMAMRAAEASAEEALAR